MKMIHSNEFQHLSEAQRYFSLARGYLEGSKVLCSALLAGDYTPQYSNTRVILHLCRHAIELFLKGAITSATNKQPPNIHHLANLVAQYDKALPDSAFRFQIPFSVETFGNSDLFTQLLDQHHKTLDQRYRYPTDNKGKPFSDPEGFIPSAFMTSLDALSKDCLRIELRLTSAAK